MTSHESARSSTVSNLFRELYLTVISFSISVLVTRQLGDYGKGEFNALAMVLSFYAPILLFGYTNGALYNSLRGKLDFKEFYLSGLILVGCLSLIVSIGLKYFIEVGMLGHVLENVSSKNQFIMLCNIPLVMVNSYNEKLFFSSKLFKPVNYRMSLAITTQLVFYLIVWFSLGEVTLENALWGVLILNLTHFLFNMGYILLKFGVELKLSGQNVLFPFIYGIKVWLNLIVAKFNDKLDSVLLTFMLSTSSYGLYVVGVSLSSQLSRLPNSYLTVVYTRMVGKTDKEMLELYYLVQRFTTLFALIFCFVLGISVAYLIPILYGEEFVDSINVALLYLPGVLFQILARMNTKFFAASGRPLKNSLVYLSGILLSLPFYFILIPPYGIYGAAFASSMAYFGAFMFSFVQMRLQFKVSLRRSVVITKDDFVFWKSYLNFRW